MNTEKIYKNFIEDDVIEVAVLGEGHINDTYMVKTASREYVLQRIQKNMNISNLEYNYSLYYEVLNKYNIEYPKWLKLRDGSHYYIDEDSNAWRMYPYIESDAIHQPMSVDMLYSYGQGLAKLHSAFRDIKKKLIPIYPHLHELKYYYLKYTNLIASDNNIKSLRDMQIEKQIEQISEQFFIPEEERQSIIHADTKLSNVLFKDGQVIGFIDFDTIMHGPVTVDIADAIRSCCIQNGKIDNDAANSLVEGYISLCDESEAKEVQNNLWHDFNKLCFELALRYYIDAVSEENYFKDKEPAYKLERAKALIDSLIV